MDQEFYDQLEAVFTNVGRDEVWKRNIGGHEIWLCSPPLPGQYKINEAMGTRELGTNVVLESKRIGLSYAIVGLDGLDFTSLRDAGPVIPVKQRDGKTLKVSLDKFIYEKLATWSGQLVDDVFSVFGDLEESQQKQNLKDVKFENAKDPELELLELEARVAELRQALGKPPLVEASGAETETETETEVKPSEESEPSSNEDFNPFRIVEENVAEAPPPLIVPRSASEVPPVRRQPHVPVAITSGPQARLDPLSVHPEPRVRCITDEDIGAPDGLPVRSGNGYAVFASDDVIEPRAAVSSPKPIVVDKLPAQAINPRFVRPPR
jgi:hypothetical protein